MEWSGWSCTYVVAVNLLLLPFAANDEDEEKTDQLMGVTMESRNGQFAVSVVYVIRLVLNTLYEVTGNFTGACTA